MPRSPGYLGFKSRNFYDIHVYLTTNRTMRRIVSHFISVTNSKDDAARMIYRDLQLGGFFKTPQGGEITKTGIREALSKKGAA